VFDWKSNWLGDRAEDYSAPALQACVEEQDYVLQYCLYLLAVHRHLDARLDDYDYTSTSAVCATRSCARSDRATTTTASM